MLNAIILRRCLLVLILEACQGCFLCARQPPCCDAAVRTIIPLSSARARTAIRHQHSLGTNLYQIDRSLPLLSAMSGTDQSSTKTPMNNEDESPVATATKPADQKDVAYSIRILTPDDQEIIWKMLVYASHDTSIESVQSQHPMLTQYAADFGTHDTDFGVVAVLHASTTSNNYNTTTTTTTADDKIAAIIGAAWVRLLPHGYGFVDKETPELAIAVVPAMRSQGIGFQLLRTLVETLRDAATVTTTATTTTIAPTKTTTPVVPAVSLSCRLENHAALKVYERLGFVTIPHSLVTNPRSGGKSVSMVCRWDDGVVIRQAQPKDVDTVLEFIQKKSDFDRSMGSFVGELQVTKQRLLETVLLNKPTSSSANGGGGCPPPYAQIWLAERASPLSNTVTSAVDPTERGNNNRTTVGFACFHFRYSSFVGRPSIWLDDLFVESTCRNQELGAAIMSELALFANKVHNATHIGWTADVRNVRGLSFYQRLGATIGEQHGNRCFLQWKPLLEKVVADELPSE
jgi:GNAT superfamily N-acetyltransferase